MSRLSLSFLGIVLDVWPAFFSRARRCSIRSSAATASWRWRRRGCASERPETPVIIAGSTGSIPATAGLMKAVLDLPNGAIVLPGLDLTLDEASWNACRRASRAPAGRPAISCSPVSNAARSDVALVKAAPTRRARRMPARVCSARRCAPPPPSAFGRNSPRPPTRPRIARRLAGVSLITAPTEQEEAAAIALVLREAVETPGKTASLVTPDRTLARRVAAELGRWGLASAPSGGEMLRATPAGIFHDLIAEAAATGSQIALLALLKHPLTRLGLPEGAAQARRASSKSPACGRPGAAKVWMRSRRASLWRSAPSRATARIDRLCR